MPARGGAGRGKAGGFRKRKLRADAASATLPLLTEHMHAHPGCALSSGQGLNASQGPTVDVVDGGPRGAGVNPRRPGRLSVRRRRGAARGLATVLGLPIGRSGLLRFQVGLNDGDRQDGPAVRGAARPPACTGLGCSVACGCAFGCHGGPGCGRGAVALPLPAGGKGSQGEQAEHCKQFHGQGGICMLIRMRGCASRTSSWPLPSCQAAEVGVRLPVRACLHPKERSRCRQACHCSRETRQGTPIAMALTERAERLVVETGFEKPA